MHYRDIDPEQRAKILKLAGAAVLTLGAVGWIVWVSIPKEYKAPSLPKEDVTEAVLQSAALRAVVAMNVAKKPLTSITEIAAGPDGKPDIKDGWGSDLVISMGAIARSQNLTLSIIAPGTDKKPSTPDDITLTGVIEYIPNYKEYSLQSSETKRGE